MTEPLPDPCPCGLPSPYQLCCGRWHSGAQRLQAPNAEALMRSRYSAYVRGFGDYILATWHPRTRPQLLEGDPPGLRWLGLEVRSHTVIDADHAVVEFVARSKLAGRAWRLHETSRFERQSGCWYYLDGTLA